jgi:transcriptional regulator with XRE-family HTH domain
VDNRAEVKAFLSSRRARITPQQAGLAAYSRNRRVAGLRRSEVADLAGVSVEYYAQLERGDLGGVSESVLDAVARALQLDEAERAHLMDLAHAAGPAARGRRKSPARHVRSSVARVLDGMTAVPAFVHNGRLDVLAANPLAEALFAPVHAHPIRPVNHARFTFLDPHARDFWIDWERAADDAVAMLRTEAGRDPHDRALTDLVGGTEHPQRRLPHPLGRAQRPPAPHRTQALAPPRRGGAAPVLRRHGTARRPRHVAHRLPAPKPAQPTTTRSAFSPAGPPPATRPTPNNANQPRGEKCRVEAE